MSRAGEGRAGAELDRMVAEKVMGWKLLDPSRPKRHQSHFIDEHGRPVSHWSDVGNHCDMYDEVYFYPSSDIAHAWEVVEKIAAREGFVVRTNTDAQGTMCRIINAAGDGVASVLAETAPLAICLAALRAVGEGE